MVKITILSPDLKKFKDKITKLRDKGFKKDIHEGIRKILPKIHRDAFLAAPKKTGALAASLHVGFEDETTGFIADGVFYGVFQEEGTRYIEPKHFMRNAVNKHFPSVGSEVTKIVKKQFNQ
ncbi:hypothetical protein DRJ17_00805 [Candidatus Woesearchaeota archaeon]|nr:MAG: hypothetical protein DRJ17_00805 [Candidatus Woesearchaeota archaeon]